MPYVPLNPKFPENRCELIKSTISKLSSLDLSELAYIIFTSGTTGEPKGVPISDAQLINYISNLNNAYPLAPEDRVMQSCELSFDVSVMQIVSAWFSGAAVCVIPTNYILMSARYVADLNITVWNSVPSLIGMSIKAGLLKANSMPSLRLAFFAGEALSLGSVENFHLAAPSAKIINAYGPTEATITVTSFEIPLQSISGLPAIIPLGFPNVDVTLSMFDFEKNMASFPNGELCIAGTQITTGYLNRRELNNEKFFTKEGVRWYRTGDIVEWSDAYGYCYKGRIDRQIKFKGYRIELQDIESALRAASKSDLVCAVPYPVLEDGTIEGLVGVIGRSSLRDENTEQILCSLTSILPSYMVPGKVLIIDEMPLSINGKVDFKAVQDWVKDQFA